MAAWRPRCRMPAAALAEVAVAFAVYRSYLPDGAEPTWTRRWRWPRSRRPELAAALAGAVSPRLHDHRDELARRMQQLSGATMAKGVEDTAYYRYARFIALNEVGGDPGEFGIGLDGVPRPAGRSGRQRQPRVDDRPVHPRHQARRGRPGPAGRARRDPGPSGRRSPSASWPRPRCPTGPSATSSPRPWSGPGRSTRDRLHAYAEKAMREASDGDHLDLAGRRLTRRRCTPRSTWRTTTPGCARPGTSWTRWSTAARLVERARPEAGPADHAGRPRRLPGHRAVGGLAGRPGQPAAGRLRRRRALLAGVDRRLPRSTPPARPSSGSPTQALRPRRDRPGAVHGYTPAAAPTDRRRAHLVAYDRGGAITLATRLPVGLRRSRRLGRHGCWTCDGAYDRHPDRSPRTSGRVPLADLLAHLPVALLPR